MGLGRVWEAPVAEHRTVLAQAFTMVPDYNDSRPIGKLVEERTNDPVEIVDLSSVQHLAPFDLFGVRLPPAE